MNKASRRIVLPIPFMVYIVSLLLSWLFREGLIWICGLALSFFIPAGQRIHYAKITGKKIIDVIDAVFFIVFGLIATVIVFIDIYY